MSPVAADWYRNETVESVLVQHVDDATFNWTLRDAAIGEPHYSLDDLAELDQKVRAGLMALVAGGESSLAICKEMLATEVPGAAFVLAYLSMQLPDGDSAEGLMRQLDERPSLVREVVAATPWVGDDHLPILFAAKNVPGETISQRLKISILALRRNRQHVGRYSNIEISGDEAKCRLLRAAGELKLSNLKGHLGHGIAGDDPAMRFWSAWSLALIGSHDNVEMLRSFVDFDTEFASRAIQIAPRILDPANCQDWLRGLAQEETSRRYALIGCGVTGDPAYIPTLINQMTIPEHARVAGEAFSMITGVDLAYDDLDTDQPEDFEAGPNDDPEDENVDLDPDEDLPWPDADLIDRWWHGHSSEYQAGVRYLCGQPISDDNCRRVLREGFQRQRISAAYELALMNPDEPLFEWRAPGFRQQEWLGLRKPRRT